MNLLISLVLVHLAMFTITLSPLPALRPLQIIGSKPAVWVYLMPSRATYTPRQRYDSHLPVSTATVLRLGELGTHTATANSP